MTMQISKTTLFRGLRAGILPAAVAGALLVGCGGGGDPLSNPGNVSNPSTTGGALRVIVAATPVADSDLTAAATDSAKADTIRASDMYKNFYSAQGVTVFGSPIQSRLFDKPLVLNVLHGGGRIFASESDPNAQLIAYWISHPVPSGQDEFSTSSYSMFTPADPATGTCNTQ